MVQSDQDHDFWQQIASQNHQPSVAITSRELRHTLTDAASSDDPPATNWAPKKAYTDGFDQIYSLETIDASSIRRMGVGEGKPASPPVASTLQPKGNGCSEDDPHRLAMTDPVAALKAKIQATPQPIPQRGTPVEPSTEAPFLDPSTVVPAPAPLVVMKENWEQLLLSLGGEFENWIEPFRLSEPIQVLGLSNLAEKGLLDNRKTRLRDLVGLDKKDFVFVKGLGQGHIDEILSKVQAYLGTGPVDRARKVDFRGLILCLLGAEDRRKAYLLTEAYGLGYLFPLSAAESAEVRHLSPDVKKETLDVAAIEVASELKRRFVLEKLGEVINAFVKPWMRSRQGLATRVELFERVERVSDDPKLARAVLQFVTRIYFENKCLFKHFLKEVAPGVFCVDEWVAKQYVQVLDRGRTYFYNAYLHYPLDTLSSFIAREFARKWQGFPEGFVEKAVRVSPRFRVRKGAKGYLEVKLA